MSISSEFKPCAVIPVYNHGKTAENVVAACLVHRLPVILVDDGSDEETKKYLQDIIQKDTGCILFTLPFNLGKGGAVSHGLKRAYEAGYSHALQIDADGQHDLEQINIFLRQAKKTPHKLIGGRPLYDESAPRGRKIGREITNFWVMLETVSRDIPDAMCGFRVYPLAACYRLMASKRLSLRMEFDIEILVRLYWSGVQMVFIPIKIIYPEGGKSHFRMIKDNLAISRIHTILFFTMLPRLPRLLFNRIKRQVKNGDNP